MSMTDKAKSHELPIEDTCIPEPAVSCTPASQAISAAPEPSQAPNKLDVQSLLELCSSIPVFHTPDGEAYAKLDTADRQETLAVSGPEFRAMLDALHYKQTKRAATKDIIDSAVNTLTLKARIEGPEESVFIRVAERNGCIYVDLADKRRQVVEITKTGWTLTAKPPVRFLRPKTMRALPEPQRGGNIDDARQFFNVTEENDFRVLIAWALDVLNPTIPCPALVLSGEAGSAKSTTTRLLLRMLDPSSTGLRAPARDVKDLFIAAMGARVLAYDNISKLTPFFSDALCRIVTGGTFAARKLYTDRDEVALVARNPLLLNGIGSFVDRSDLLDRSIVVSLTRVTDETRRPEAEIDASFDELLPKILGVLFDAVAGGLRDVPNTKLSELPRMADAVLWASACERALGWEKGSILRAFKANQRKAVEVAVDGDPMSAAIYELMHDRESWQGTATQLLAALRMRTDQGEQRSLPSGPSGLGQVINRASTSLRKLGIEIRQWKENNKKRARMIEITRRDPKD
jgi:hypothetical protein